jgi:hypothetical protein
MQEGYVPECLCDEVSPPPRPHPDAWRTQRGERFFIDQSDDHSADEDNDACELKNGQSYEFCRLVQHGSATLTFGADSSWSVDHPMPAAAEMMWIPADHDTLAGSVDELASFLKEAGEDEGEHGLEYFTWENEFWTFDAETKRFVRGAA